MNVSLKKRWSAALGLALVASTVGGLAASADEPAPLAWYSGSNATVDDPARSAVPLKLYDAAGTAVTSGALSAPLPAFAAADGSVRPNDSYASLFIHQTQSSTAAGAWPGVQATGTSKFTGAGAQTAPAPLTGKPYVSTAGGYTFGDATAAFAGAAQGDFAGVYELRLRTSSATEGVSREYASTFVRVSGGNWEITDSVEGDPDPATTVTTATVPAAGTYGTAFKVTASVTETGGSGGTVTVKKGSTALASATLPASGTVVISVPGTKLVPGTHGLTVAYSGTATAKPSVSVAKSIKTAKAKSATAGKLAAKTIRKSKKAKITVTVKASGVPLAGLTGTITVKDGSKVIKRAALKAGKVVITLPKLKVGKHKLTVVYSGNANVAGSTSAKYSLTVKK